MTQRFIGIDIARAFAILLVTWKHSMASYGAGELTDSWALTILQLVMQLATPIFLVLFGAMLEVVYLPRHQNGRKRDVARRLYRRSLQCYGYYCLAIIVFFFVLGTYSWLSLPFVFTGFISVPYSHLLAFYTVALALAPLLLIARQRYGLVPLIIASSLVHIFYAPMSQLPAAPEFFSRDYLQHMSGFIYGKGVDFIGPSLIHGLSLVCFGMLFGQGLSTVRHDTHRIAGTSLNTLWMIGIAFMVILFTVDWRSPGDTITALTDATLRKASHPLYFSVGILGSIAITQLFVCLYDGYKQQWGRSIEVFGRRSLFAFGVGNILSALSPQILAERYNDWCDAFVLFTIVVFLTIIYDRMDRMRIIESLVRSCRNNINATWRHVIRDM